MDWVFISDSIIINMKLPPAANILHEFFIHYLSQLTNLHITSTIINKFYTFARKVPRLMFCFQSYSYEIL